MVVALTCTAQVVNGYVVNMQAVDGVLTPAACAVSLYTVFAAEITRIRGANVAM